MQNLAAASDTSTKRVPAKDAAPEKSVPSKSAPVKSAPARLARKNLLKVRLAWRKSTPDRADPSKSHSLSCKRRKALAFALQVERLALIKTMGTSGRRNSSNLSNSRKRRV